MSSPDAAFEAEVRRIGQHIFDVAGKDKPSVFDGRWWSGKVMDWSMKDPAFKLEMFRFVDVFPTLRSAEEVAQHLQEYFCRPGKDFPKAMQWGLSAVSPRSLVAKAAAAAVRKNMTSMAGRFIAGANVKDALKVLGKLRKQKLAFTVDLLGEATLAEGESLEYLERYHALLDALIEAAPSWKDVPVLDDSPAGPVPRVNVSVKVSALYSQLDPIDLEHGVEVLAERLTPLFVKAAAAGAFINLDLEQYAYKDVTYAAFRRVLEAPELADYPHVGVVCQAYLRDSAHDLEQLRDFAVRRGAPFSIRLVKGAYWDYETVLAAQEGHECPVYTVKAHTDANYERLTRFLFENRKWLRPAIGSHNVRSIAVAAAEADRLGVPPGGFEVQMLFGMAEPLKRAVASLGIRLRDYVPIGEIIPGMAYLVRRLLENTSNEGFLRSSFIEGVDTQKLLAAPVVEEAAVPEPVRGLPDFANEPLRDFRHPTVRAAFAEALTDEAAARAEPADPLPLFYGGEQIVTEPVAESLDPATEQVLGRVCDAGVDEADRAVAEALAAFPAWRDTPVRQRAELLFETAKVMRGRRDRLAALQVLEVGKGWREADADVCEAIDFLEYYGREMLRLAPPQQMGDRPGEDNRYLYEPRGVAVVIAPWNFPLAILTGMVAAPLVAGNCVIAKPAEQSPLVAWSLFECLREAGLPAGVAAYLPGPGEVVGAHLVRHPDIAFVAFTGSREVGFDILRAAAEVSDEQPWIKRVICELGGKNAIIVDGDADLDEAVAGVVASAFGFQGQKCSACSRVVVLDSAYDDFVQRLVAATDSLVIGAPVEPGSKVGPVVDAEAQARVQRYQALAAEEGEILLQREVPEQGFYVGPTLVAGIRPEHRLAQEEIFGPVLAIMRVKSFDEALAVAMGTRYALTGGLYSRSPLNIERARREFRVGNLYINRRCTGALVERQAFGGARWSGVGSKAGGPDYLRQFLDPRVVTENTMRRGFAPETA